MAIKQAGSIKKPAKGSFDVKIITKTPTIIVKNIPVKIFKTRR